MTVVARILNALLEDLTNIALSALFFVCALLLIVFILGFTAHTLYSVAMSGWMLGTFAFGGVS